VFSCPGQGPPQQFSQDHAAETRLPCIYAATVAWDGEPCPVLVHSVDSDPLLGTALLVGCDLRVRVEIGGGVEIEAIP
jgi:hypothetical protein